MKAWVVTDAKGKIIGTMNAAAGSKDGPTPGRPTAMKGQRVHEVELPPHLEETRDAAVLHKQLAKLVAALRKKPTTSARKRR